jgi:large subunit ribosomal protein L20
MSRVKGGMATNRRKKRLLKQTKGFWGQRSNVFRRAKETLIRAMRFAYISRKLKKRDMRGLFISRINAACKKSSVSYSSFIGGLKKNKIELNRKMLSQLAIFEPEAFVQLVNTITKK